MVDSRFRGHRLRFASILTASSLLLVGLLMLFTGSASVAAPGGQAGSSTPEASATGTVPALLVAPNSGPVGTLHLIFMDDLEPGKTYRLRIIHRSSGYQPVDREVSADSGGKISFNFTSTVDMRGGEYAVALYDGNTVIQRGTLTLDAPAIPPTRTPAPTDAVTATETPDADGTAAMDGLTATFEYLATLGPSATITPTMATETPAAAVVEPLMIEPASGPIGTTHTISGTGLTPDGAYRLDVVYSGTNEVVFSMVVLTDADGVLNFSVFSETSDEPGDYRIELFDGDTLVRSGIMTIEAATGGSAGTETPATPTLTPTAAVGSPDDNVLVPGTLRSGELLDDESGDTYVIEGQAGMVVTLRLDSADFDAYLLLFDPSGAIIMRNDNAGGSFNAAIVGLTLPEDGTYQVAVTSRDNIERGDQGSTGSYTLSYTVARNADGGEIASGETVLGEITAGDSESPAYTFTASAGDVVTIDLASDAFDPFVILVDPEGRQIASDDDAGPALYARIEGFDLPDSGTYTILVDGYRGPTGQREISGPYLLALTIAGEAPLVFAPTAAPTTDAPLLEATSTDSDALPITYGAVITGEIRDNRPVLYQFSGSAGDQVSIALNADAFDPYLTLTVSSASGAVIAQDDDSGPGVYALIDVELPSNGVYLIEVDGYRGVNGERELAGSYTLSLSGNDILAQATPVAPSVSPTPLPPITGSGGTITSGESLTGTLQGEVQTARYTFSAGEGDVVTIDLTSDFFDAYVLLLDSDGNPLAQDDDSGGGTQARIEALVIPAEGEYTIVVDAFRGFSGTGEVDGDYTLTLNIEAGGDVVTGPTATPRAPRLGLGTSTPAPDITATDEGSRLGLGTSTPTPDAEIPTLTASPTPIPTESAPDTATQIASVPPTQVVQPPVLPAPTLPPVVESGPGGAGKPLPPLAFDPFMVGAQPVNVDTSTTASLTGAPGEALVFSVNAAAGETVALYVFYTDVEIDTLLHVFAPDGTRIAFDDDSGRTFNPEILPLTLPQSGEYRLVIQPYVNGSMGELELYYLHYTPYRLSSEPQQVFITDKFQQVPVVIDVTAGQQVRLVVRRLSYDTGTAVISVSQNGLLLAQTSLLSGNRVALDFTTAGSDPVQIDLRYEGIGGALLEFTVEPAGE